MAGLRIQQGSPSPKPLPKMATRPPQLKTQRLLLRALRLADAPRVRRLAGERAVASTTVRIPHPYEDGMAEQWIHEQQRRYRSGQEVSFAIVLRSRICLIGSIGLRLNPQHCRGELGYWIGKPYWNRGYATEAAEAVLRYGFETLGLHRICAYHFRRNRASGRVLEKIGMIPEATLRQHVSKWGTFEDLEGYGILRSKYAARSARGGVP